MGQHEKAMKKYLDSIDYLEQYPTVTVGAMELARQLDANWRTQAYAEYLRTIRYIESLNPALNKEREEEEDELLSPNR